jgi:hypothetical protein
MKDYENLEPIKHFNSRLAGQNVMWTGQDNEDRFTAHMANPKTAEKLINLGWDKPNCITYSYNSHGFRTSNFTDEESGIALGCSFTEGVGIPNHQSWPSVLSQLLNINIYNLGIGGASIDTAFRLLDHYIDKLNVKFVALCSPEKSRFEIFDQGYPVNILSGLRTKPEFIIPYLKHRLAFSDDIESEINHKKNLLAMQQLCAKHNVHFIHIPVRSFKCNYAGRDLAHPGPEPHKIFADQMFKQIQEVIL